jgi:thioredoxin-like negative regulator of GroEL
MSNQFKILSVPTYIILKDGQEVHRANGAKTKEQLQELVNYGQ